MFDINLKWLTILKWEIYTYIRGREYSVLFVTWESFFLFLYFSIEFLCFKQTFYIRRCTLLQYILYVFIVYFYKTQNRKNVLAKKIRIHRKSIWSVNLKQWEYNVRSNESLEIYIYFIFFQERTILCRMDQDDHGHNPFGLGQQVGTCMHVYWLWLGSVEGRDYMAVRD
jgi:hypothetical protein